MKAERARKMRLRGQVMRDLRAGKMGAPELFELTKREPTIGRLRWGPVTDALLEATAWDANIVMQWASSRGPTFDPKVTLSRLRPAPRALLLRLWPVARGVPDSASSWGALVRKRMADAEARKVEQEAQRARNDEAAEAFHRAFRRY